jgi:hypothetical protein
LPERKATFDPGLRIVLAQSSLRGMTTQHFLSAFFVTAGSHFGIETVVTFRCCIRLLPRALCCAGVVTAFTVGCVSAIAEDADPPARTHNAPTQLVKEEKHVETQAERWKREEVMHRALGRDSDEEVLKNMLITIGVPVLIIFALVGVLQLRG